MRNFIKYCKKYKIDSEDFLVMIMEFMKDDRKKAEIFKFIYQRRRVEDPQSLSSVVKEKMCKKFKVGLRTLEKYIYWK